MALVVAWCGNCFVAWFGCGGLAALARATQGPKCGMGFAILCFDGRCGKRLWRLTSLSLGTPCAVVGVTAGWRLGAGLAVGAVVLVLCG